MYRRNTEPRQGIARARTFLQVLGGVDDARAPDDSSDRVPDSGLVARAAAVAALSEFDLFRAAWQRWSGKRPDERLIEPDFARYLHDGRVPAYVRHFARHLVDRAQADGIDRDGLSFAGYRRSEPLPDLRSPLVAEVLTCALIVLVTVLV